MGISHLKLVYPFQKCSENQKSKISCAIAFLAFLVVSKELALAMGKNRRMGGVLTYVYVLLQPIFVPKLITLNH